MHPLRTYLQALLTIHNSSVGNRSLVSASHIAPDREVSVQPGDHLLGTRGVPPVPHEIASNGEQAHGVHASLGHSVVGDVADKLRGGSGRLDVGPDGIASLTERKSQEGGADVGRDAGNDDLLLLGGLDSVAELLVVPGVDLAVSLDERRAGVHLQDLVGEGTIGA